MIYYAHSDPDGLPENHVNSRWQKLSEHLVQVATLARQFAREAAPENLHFQELAFYAGLLHDFGKYSDEFQQRVRGVARSAPHAYLGAAIAFTSTSVGMSLRSPHIAFAVAGHHAGMPDAEVLTVRTSGEYPSASSLVKRASVDCPELGALLNAGPVTFESSRDRLDLLTRMVFSVLVDADRIDSARRVWSAEPLAAADKLAKLQSHIAALDKRKLPASLRDARARVLSDCLRAANSDHRLLSLSVPTGGGKTLSTMALALARAAKSPGLYRRIIVVIPFLSIIEQNASIYKSIFGEDAVLEHHSGAKVRTTNEQFVPASHDESSYLHPSELDDSENWNAPLIVTTSIRFFESLFSNHPSDLRRVHNIAKSIVILDEVQVLPSHLLAPLLGIIRELADHWGCTFVFSTATQPAFELPTADTMMRTTRTVDPRWQPDTMHEVISDPRHLYTSLLRVNIEWRMEQPVAWSEVAAWIRGERQCLCIVNTRAHARALYELLVSDIIDGVFHLSTRMCAQHRLDVLTRIKKRLDAGLDCRVVSTQLIEAGVDVDFPSVFRAIAPLDSIIQTAGRADRNGRATSEAGKPAGKVVVFLPADNRLPPGAYEYATAKTRELAANRNIQCDDLDTLRLFYDRLYADQDLGHELAQLRKQGKFKTLADAFEMISDRRQDVYVPYCAGVDYVDELMKVRVLTRDLRRSLQLYSVGLRVGEFHSARAGALIEINEGTFVASSTSYDKDLGFVIPEVGQALFA